MVFRMFNVGCDSKTNLVDISKTANQGDIYKNVDLHYKDNFTTEMHLGERIWMSVYDINDNGANAALITLNKDQTYVKRLKIVGNQSLVDSVVEKLDLENLAEEVK